MKLIGNRLEVFQGRGGNLSHHSLVTPIDWKPRKPTPHTPHNPTKNVTTRL
jgi:hypothetical protein